MRGGGYLRQWLAQGSKAPLATVQNRLTFSLLHRESLGTPWVTASLGFGQASLDGLLGSICLLCEAADEITFEVFNLRQKAAFF